MNNGTALLAGDAMGEPYLFGANLSSFQCWLLANQKTGRIYMQVNKSVPFFPFCQLASSE
ncbi:hypothetical protein GIW41_26405 [Pseudomonas sp. PA-6-1D]|uniref:hypothetical protein n=1 Tax=Pseudomonas TaxID=286 RepID=UPI001EF0A86D|nr:MULTISPECIES: hypothetical protein [Pseudomonas]MCF5140775.1 hypothetical protein [Pseudomonas sp. PA-6-3C]MCF5150685.1 hypothetical protein [Pseudomonas sp. PA-6-3F]MCF5162489.1 hypothetical protein [Pseudomonas sp. PA-6-2E]MCF5178795.1 hypothetical protein [Pseudomonas sp. PA-6-1D]MCF5195820.1 hypothetical protein [Pseudomonas sp. PA-6-1H]